MTEIPQDLAKRSVPCLLESSRATCCCVGDANDRKTQIPSPFPERDRRTCKRLSSLVMSFALLPLASRICWHLHRNMSGCRTRDTLST